MNHTETAGRESRVWTYAAVVFFALLLLAGLLVFRDYGISWDEPFQRAYGLAVYDFATSGNPDLFESPNKYYGPAFETLLVLVEKGLDLKDERSIYLARHLTTFLLFWIGCIFFYKLMKRLLRSPPLALLGCVLLVMSPRILANSFYNTKDLPFLSVFIIAVYTGVLYFDRMSLRRAALHAIASAVLVDIRVVGVMIPLFTLGIGGVLAAAGGRARGPARIPAGKLLLSEGFYLGVTAAMVLLMWPTLWRQPFSGFVEAFREMSRYPYRGMILYLGRYVMAEGVPWHYIPVWIGISVPLAYLFFFLAGSVGSLLRLVFRVRAFPLSRPAAGLLLAWFLLPPVYVNLSGAVVYDGWRHLFFIYPALVGLAVAGTAWLARLGAAAGSRAVRLLSVVSIVTVLALGVLGAGKFLIMEHPYGNVFFNALVGGPHGAEGRFDLDYWGLSYGGLLKYIVKHDMAARIPIRTHTRPGETNAMLLPAADRKRLVFVDHASKAKYYITNLRWERPDFRPEQIVHEVKAGGATLSVAALVPHGPGR
jgi:hypothetical protein